MAAFSDTANKTGLIQHCERWTGLGDGAISGNATLLKQFTAAINDAFDQVLPLILSRSTAGKWDDANNTDQPILTVNLVSGQNAYSEKIDNDSLDILRVFDVEILTSAGATTYTRLEKITGDDDRALATMSPDSTQTGTPDHWLERDGTIFLGPNPNYSATAGIKIFYERDESYFVSTDTTKVPGIPRLFHTLLGDIASYEWLTQKKPLAVTAIQALEQKIAKREQQLSDMEDARNPVQLRMGISTNPIPGRSYRSDSNR